MKTKLIIEFESDTPLLTLERVGILSLLAVNYHDVIKPTLTTDVEMSDIRFEHEPDVLYRGDTTR